MQPIQRSLAIRHVFGILVGLWTSSSSGTTSRLTDQPPHQPRLGKHDRARLAWLVSEGRQTASLLIAYRPLTGDVLVQRLGALGGRRRYQSDSLGYLRIDIPTDRVLEAAEVPGIDAINLNGTQVYGASVEATEGVQRPRGGASELAAVGLRPTGPNRWRVAPPDASTPRENPYLPMKDVGAPQFVADHPTFDGRGVTIGSIECCPDFKHPVFQEPALTLDGRPTRKLAALYTLSANDSEATNRVHARDSVLAEGRRFAYEGVSYRAPRDGPFRIGFYRGPTSFKLRAGWRADTLDAPADRRAVLLDPRSGEVWVDKQRDHDLSRGSVLRDYNTTGDVAAFGRDDPATPWDDRLSFAVGVDTARGVVDIYPGNNGHITGVAGIAVGSRFYGSAATGAAPGARMVFVSEDGGWKGIESHQSNRIEAMILLARLADVDIISTQEWYDLRLKDGHSVWSIIADRLVTTYHKAIFVSAGNEGSGLGSVGEAANGAHVMKVGGSIDRDTWYTNFALIADRKSYLFNNSSRGPDAAGGISPDFVTPMAHLIAQPMGTSGDPVIRINTGHFSSRAIYQNPPGYTLQMGTSLSTPTAAGVAALLVSAAKQTHTAVDPMRLRWALAGGAHYLPEYQAYEQGSGLLDVRSAWARLQGAPPPIEIVAEAPVRTILSHYLEASGLGHGLYEREGWAPGDSATRVVTFVRTSGPAEPVSYRLRWLGNDGTFASAATRQLGSRTSLPITVHPRTAGSHSALLQLIGDDCLTPTYQMSAVVIAANPLDPAHHYRFVEHGHAEWLGKTSYFIAVPPRTAALDLRLAIEQGAVALIVHDPSGGGYPSAVQAMRGRHWDWPDDIAIGRTQQQLRGVIRRTIEFPEPGVWELIVEHEGSATPELRSKRQQAAAFTLVASVTRMTLPPADVDAAMPGLSKGDRLAVALHNDLAAVAVRVVGGPLSSARREILAFQRSETAIVREIVADSGTRLLGFRLAHASNPTADIDLHVFDCTSGHCDRHVSAVFRGADKELRVRNPRPGRWRIVIDPYELPPGTTTVEFDDELVHPKYGSAAVDHPLVRLDQGGFATLNVRLHPGVAPEQGRLLELRLEALCTTGQSPSGPARSGGARYPPGILGVMRFDLSNR